MKKLLLLAGLAASLGWTQSGQSTNQVAALPNEPWVKLLFYDGSNNLQYICAAKAIQPTTTYSVAAGNLTNIVVTGNTTATITATGHKLYVGARLVITGSATTTLNGTFSAVTAADANTLTITVPSTTNATYTDMTITTVNPLTSAKVWGIEVLTNPSNLLSSVYFALTNGAPAFGSGMQYADACDSRGKY